MTPLLIGQATTEALVARLNELAKLANETAREARLIDNELGARAGMDERASYVAMPGRWLVWQLANDPAAYGDNAGKWIVVTADLMDEVTGVLDTQEEAQAIADEHNASEA